MKGSYCKLVLWPGLEVWWFFLSMFRQLFNASLISRGRLTVGTQIFEGKFGTIEEMVKFAPYKLINSWESLISLISWFHSPPGWRETCDPFWKWPLPGTRQSPTSAGPSGWGIFWTWRSPQIHSPKDACRHHWLQDETDGGCRCCKEMTGYLGGIRL